MHHTRSDIGESESERYKDTIRAHLRANNEVASKEDLQEGTDVPAWYITQIATEDIFYTSLNHNGEYVASKYVVGTSQPV